MLKEGLQHARIDTIVGSAPAAPGMPGDETPAARRWFWAALFSQQRATAQRTRDDDSGRRAA